MRIATNRDVSDGSIEWIEINEQGVFFWKASDASLSAECSFPVDLEFVADFFKKIGRTLEVHKLPSNFVANLY